MIMFGLELELGLEWRFYHAAAAAHGSEPPGRKMLTQDQPGIYMEFNKKLFFHTNIMTY
jgi:hypothetical protein